MGLRKPSTNTRGDVNKYYQLSAFCLCNIQCFLLFQDILCHYFDTMQKNLNIMQIFLTLFVSLEPSTKNKWCRNWIRISFNMVSENELSLIWTLPQFVVWALITMEKYIWPQQYQCHIYADDSGLSAHLECCLGLLLFNIR